MPPSNTSNAGLTFFISLQIASHHRVFPLLASICHACMTLLGISILNLCVLNQYFDLVLAIILLRFFRTDDDHQANTGSSEMCDDTVYSVTCTGYYSLMSFNAIQSVLPSFHRTSNSQPRVVPLHLLVPVLVVINASCCFTACSLDRCPVISSMSTWRLPSSSICANRFSAMLLAANDVHSPSRYSTSYILVSKMGFSLAKPIGRPFASFSCFVTLAILGSKLSP